MKVMGVSTAATTNHPHNGSLSHSYTGAGLGAKKCAVVASKFELFQISYGALYVQSYLCVTARKTPVGAEPAADWFYCWFGIGRAPEQSDTRQDQFIVIDVTDFPTSYG